MAYRNSSLMTPDEIVQEIKEIRGEIERSADRLYELARVLYTKVKRTDPQERMVPRSDSQEQTDSRPELQKRGRDTQNIPTTVRSSLSTYANAWARFAGVVGQGLRRTASIDRVLKLAHQQEQDRQEQRQRLQDRENRRIKKVTSPSSLIPSEGVEDLVALYGQEVLDHASK